jgi:hypothetical protein
MYAHLKRQVKATRAWQWLQPYRAMATYAMWLHDGKPVPPPHIVKQMVVREFANRHPARVLVETGTFLGDMVHAVRDNFEKLHSIELSEELAERARTRFAGDSRITIHSGDSADVLRRILAQVKQPCIFWLDGHYSGGFTALGAKETPIRAEMEAIFAHGVDDHVILIDDARCFDGTHDYPTVDELRSIVHQSRPGWSVLVQDDIIRIHR